MGTFTDSLKWATPEVPLKLIIFDTGAPSQPMREVHKHINDIERLCLTHKVNKLYAFGSILTDQFNEKSDVDFIVDFEPIDLNQYADNYYDLKFSLEEVFHRSVDLLEEKAIKNPYFLQVVNSKRQLIYGH